VLTYVYIVEFEPQEWYYSIPVFKVIISELLVRPVACENGDTGFQEMRLIHL
jgi:hypothetical protein